MTSGLHFTEEMGELLLKRAASRPKGRLLNPLASNAQVLKRAAEIKVNNPVTTHILQGPAEDVGRNQEARLDQGSKTLTLDLPMPPTIDAYFIPVPMPGKTTAKFILGRDGKAYREEVASLITLRGAKTTILYRVNIRMVFHFISRRGDIDNRVKPLWDALTYARVWHDDGQVDHDSAERGERHDPPRVVLTITEHTETPKKYEVRCSEHSQEAAK